MSDKQSMSFHGTIGVEAAASYLEALAQGLRDRHIHLAAEDEALDIDVPVSLLFELKTKSTAGKSKASLDLSLSWRRSTESDDGGPGLKIAGRQADAEPNGEALPPPMDE